MKKLMMAVAIVCAAVATQAGTVTWGNPFGINAINSPGDDGDLFGGKIYLVDGSSESFFAAAAGEGGYGAALAAATILANADIDGVTMSNPSTGSFNIEGYLADIAASTGAHDLFVTTIDGDGNFYISETITDTINDVGATEFIYYHDAAYAGKSFAQDGGYQGAGWYSSVPEPTSGLLLLLGVAGLALRRRRA